MGQLGAALSQGAGGSGHRVVLSALRQHRTKNTRGEDLTQDPKAPSLRAIPDSGCRVETTLVPCDPSLVGMFLSRPERRG